MKNSELQQLLASFPDDMDIMIFNNKTADVRMFIEEHLLLTSETAHIDNTAPVDEWDHEDGKVTLGDGKQLLLINPPIV